MATLEDYGVEIEMNDMKFQLNLQYKSDKSFIMTIVHPREKLRFILHVDSVVSAFISRRYHGVEIRGLWLALKNCFIGGIGRFTYCWNCGEMMEQSRFMNSPEDQERIKETLDIGEAKQMIFKIMIPSGKGSFKKSYWVIVPRFDDEKPILKLLKQTDQYHTEKSISWKKWKARLSTDRPVKEKILDYCMVLVGRVIDVTPKVYTHCYTEFKRLFMHFDDIHPLKKYFKGVDDWLLSWLCLSWTHEVFQKKKMAMKYLEKILSAANNSPQLSFVYFSRARLLSPEKAVIDYTKSINYNSRFPLPWLNRGNIYKDFFHDYERSLKDYNQCLECDPSFGIAYCNRGVLYKVCLKNSVAALKDYSLAIKCDPKEPVFYLNRALLYIELKKYYMAEVDLNKCILYDQKNADYYVHRGILYLNYLLDVEKAISDLNEAIRLNCNHPNAHFYRGKANFNKDHHKSFSDFRRAIELQSEFLPEAYFLRSQLYQKHHNIPQALNDIDKAIESSPANSTYHLEKSNLLQAVGREEEAKQSLKTANLLQSKMPS